LLKDKRLYPIASDQLTMSNLEQKYKKLDHREHVLSRPGMYVGSIEQDVYNTWVFSEETGKFTKREIKSVPGLYKIFDEVLVNAIDQVIRLKQLIQTKQTSDEEHHKDITAVKNIKITIDKETGLISVFNDGDGIEVEKHPEHNIYIPELIFGNMLTSTNYNDEEEKIIGGQNGIGAKACNIFSKTFTIETVDHRRKKIYCQQFSNNMTERTEPLIKYCAKKPYTMITFLPDYKKFNLDGLPNDMHDLFIRRCYDICALTENDINVWVNGKKLEYKNFERYVDLYLGDKSAKFRAYEKLNDRWEVIASYTEMPGFEQVSFVNGIWTVNGGKHVDNITNQITAKLGDAIIKKKKQLDVKPQHIKNYLMLFVKSTITNPTFDSQSKECLTTPASKFGSKADIPDRFIEKLYKSELVDKIMSLCDANATKNLKKTDGKKAARVMVPKLDDANWAGTKNSHECTLILTEGLSARTMAISGLSVVGRDKYGVFPLRGKVLNVKDAQPKKIQENEEITNLKKILGLEHNKEYNDVSQLRYGHIMIMVDSDADGSHIKGLLFNVFQSLWPTLYKMQGFLTCMLTPIIKAISARQTIQFYSLTDYDNWKQIIDTSGDNLKGWKIKYYKGLGTSSETEAKQYFKEMKQVTYLYNDVCDEAIDLAFNKKRSDDRKSWLMGYNRSIILDCSQQEVSYDEFVHKELIHFSNRDLERSINHMCDGLKESTRKILFGCFKRKLYKDEIKVAQLAAYVSEISAYHHGEVSLQQAIVGMAQLFVGSNNINLLMPNGQFGTRVHGGADAASARYIFTVLNKLTRLIFREADESILNYLDDDGIQVEPEYYMPIIPMILVNGGIGIGTGFSTNVPCFNPHEVIELCEKIISKIKDVHGNIYTQEQIESLKQTVMDVELNTITPWYFGFKGSIVPHKDGVYISKGIYTWSNNQTLDITELPVGTWTDDYKEFLMNLMNNNKYLKDFESKYYAKTVNFTLKLTPNAHEELGDKFETEFKLTSTKNLSLNNIHLHSHEGAIRNFKTINDIIKNWTLIRIEKYIARRSHQLSVLNQDFTILSSKARFIQAVIDGVVKIHNMSLDNIEQQLIDQEYPQKSSSYDYLTHLPVYSFTKERKNTIDNDVVSLQQTITDLELMSVQDIWQKELDELKVALVDYYQQMSSMDCDDETNIKKPVAQRKRAPIKKI
jgi:DNA topoisomerase-2